MVVEVYLVRVEVWAWWAAAEAIVQLGEAAAETSLRAAVGLRWSVLHSVAVPAALPDSAGRTEETRDIGHHSQSDR